MDENQLSKKGKYLDQLCCISIQKKLLNKTRYAQKTLNRFDAKIHARIYTKIFMEI